MAALCCTKLDLTSSEPSATCLGQHPTSSKITAGAIVVISEDLPEGPSIYMSQKDLCRLSVQRNLQVKNNTKYVGLAIF